jgi:hypothetical protein
LTTAGNHPDVHRLGPEGPGRQVVIGGPGKARGIRDLIGELALLPVEGGARVAIIEAAHRMNEDAQAALLKTLEEPPAATTIVLCADAEEPLLPTIRSRCARIRLGPVGVRDIEAILAAQGAAEPPVAARVARIAGGRPGLALAWVRTTDALRDRDAIARSLLDLADARPGERLATIRGLVGQAVGIATVTGLAVTGSSTAPTNDAAGATDDGSKPPRGARRRAPEPAPEPTDGGDEALDPVGPARTPAAERRRAAEALIGLWTDVARDLALCQQGLERIVPDIGALDDTCALAARLEPGDLGGFLDRLGSGAVLVAGNVSPELVLDDLALAWPRPRRAA